MNTYNTLIILLSFLFSTTQAMETIFFDPIKNLIFDGTFLTTQEIIKRFEEGSLGKEFQTKLLFLKSLKYSSPYANPTYMPYNRAQSAFKNTLNRLKEILQSNNKNNLLYTNSGEKPNTSPQKNILKNLKEENRKNNSLNQHYYQCAARILKSLNSILNEHFFWAKADIKDGIAQTNQENLSIKTKKTSKKNPLFVYMAADNDLREFAIAKKFH